MSKDTERIKLLEKENALLRAVAVAALIEEEVIQSGREVLERLTASEDDSEEEKRAGIALRAYQDQVRRAEKDKWKALRRLAKFDAGRAT